MNRVSRPCSTGKHPAAANEECAGEAKKPRITGWRDSHRLSTVTMPSQSLAVDRHPLRQSFHKVSSRPESASPSVVAIHATAVLHTAKTKDVKKVKEAEEVKGSVFASPYQQSVGMSTGARPRRRPQAETRNTALQAAPAIVPLNVGMAGSSTQSPVPPVLPGQLSAKGYRLTSTELFSNGATQSVYSLARGAMVGPGKSGFVVKFPCEEGRVKTLQGLKIQEKLASLENGDKYFVPVVEKVIKYGRLVCHVEPEGVPVTQYIKSKKNLQLTQKLSMFSRILTAVETMHDQKIAHLDIKPDNLIMKDPAIDMTVRFCDFEFAREFHEADKKGVIQVGTYIATCAALLDRRPCSPEIADLWAFTLTVWMLMSSDIPSLHWLYGAMYITERRNQLFPVLAEYFSWPGLDCVPERTLPSGKKVKVFDHDTGLKLCRWLRFDTAEWSRRKLQSFLWKYLKFPADIDYLRRLCPAEKCMLKELLSIMFSQSGYRDKLVRVHDLISAALRCAETLETHSEYNEERVLQTIQGAGYLPCNHVEMLPRAIRAPYLSCPSGHSSNGFHGGVLKVSAACSGNEQGREIDDFVVRKQRLIKPIVKKTASSWNDVRNIFVDHCSMNGSLDLLENKSDLALSLWLTAELHKRCELKKNTHQLKHAC